MLYWDPSFPDHASSISRAFFGYSNYARHNVILYGKLQPKVVLISQLLGCKPYSLIKNQKTVK